MNIKNRLFKMLFSRERQVKLKDGWIVLIEYEGDSPRIGSPIVAVSRDGEKRRIPLPKGTYQTEDGRHFRVCENQQFQGFVEMTSLSKEDLNELTLEQLGEIFTSQLSELDKKMQQRFDELQEKFGLTDEVTASQQIAELMRNINDY